MVSERLEPHLDLLREEYVLVQAWKKTASYIRYHNWFSDTLALDRAAVNLPAFIDELRERLQSSKNWQNDLLRIVPAPKSQRWRVREGAWEPVEKRATSVRLRPLAHVSLADQVVATALMLCLADRVETLQGDPRRSARDQESRRQVVSYGNRLFCDAMGGELRHRWGSAKLYRAYYQDYRRFCPVRKSRLSRFGQPSKSVSTLSMRTFDSSMIVCTRICSPKRLTGSAATAMTRNSSVWQRPCSIGAGSPMTKKRTSGSTRSKQGLRTSHGWRYLRASSPPDSSRTSCCCRSTRRCARRSEPRSSPGFCWRTRAGTSTTCGS